MSNEAAVQVGGKDTYEVNPISNAIGAAEQLGAWMGQSNLFGVQNLEQAKLMAITCICEKITPLQFSQTYDVVKGKVSMKAGAMLAKFVSAGGDYDVKTLDAKCCTINFTWRKKKTDYTFTIDEAKAMGLVKGDSNWTKVPKNMLFWRCVSNYLRMFVPELFAGHYMIDEQLEDVTVSATQPKIEVEVTETKVEKKAKKAKEKAEPAAIDVEASVVEVSEPEADTLSGMLILKDLNLKAVHAVLKEKKWVGEWVDEDTFCDEVDAFDQTKVIPIRKGIESGVLIKKVKEIEDTMKAGE